MADIAKQAPVSPSTEDGFLADRLSFWASATKFMTRTVIALVILLALMWWFLVR